MARVELIVSPIDHGRAIRIIPSCYPPIDLFEQVANPDDLESTLWAESLTNARLREQVGDLGLVAPEDRVSGLGTSPIMAAFTHPNPDGSRFSDGSFGVYYAATDEETAVRETVFHRERFLRMTPEITHQIVAMRAYVGRVQGNFVDLRDLADSDPVYAPDSYIESQRLGRILKAEAHWGVAYRSVRNPGGECVGVLRPPACAPVVQSAHYHYHYSDGNIRDVALSLGIS